MDRIIPDRIEVASFSPDGEHEHDQTVVIPLRAIGGQQTLTLGDYEVTLHPDGDLSIEIATLSGADRLAMRRFHSGAVTITAKG
jgi:hypothetical protein